MNKLDRTWKNSLRMWKWVSGNLPKNFMKLSGLRRNELVNELKSRWLKKNRFKKPVRQNCFFCEYADYDNDNEDWCSKCPGRLVNRRLRGYWCNNEKQGWFQNPKAFYRELVRLDEKRKGTNP